MINNTITDISSQAFKGLEDKFLQIHNSKYSYINSVYVNKSTKINIVCPIHGEFQQAPSAHLKGQGCFKCAAKSRGLLLRKSATTFINEANIIHNNKYSYTNIEYKTNKDPIVITCPIHKNFIQTPSEHLAGSGCTKCGYITVGNKIADSTFTFIEKAKAVHGNRFDYTGTTYIKSNLPVTIKCSVHGEFQQLAVTHTQGSICPKCVLNQFKTPKDYKNKLTYLYYIKILNYYKIGITTTTLNERYSKDIKLGMKYEILGLWKFNDGEIAALIEADCLRNTLKYQLISHKQRTIIPTTKGSSELRSINIQNTINKLLKKAPYEKIH